MSAQGDVGPEGTLSAEVIHKNGTETPVQISPVQKLINLIKGWFGNA